jgi:hypothetical protein
MPEMFANRRGWYGWARVDFDACPDNHLQADGLACELPHSCNEIEQGRRIVKLLEPIRGMTVHSHWNPTDGGNLRSDLLFGQDTTPSGLGALRELDLDHSYLRERHDGGCFLVIEPAIIGAASELGGADLVQDVTATFDVVRRQRPFAGTHVALGQLGGSATRSRSWPQARSRLGGEVATHIALGADIVHIGRGFLFSLGCIQALRCHTNTCPTGVTAQNRWLQSGLNPADKSVRVFNYALALERDLQMITHACGLEHPSQLTREHVVVNVSPGVRKPLVELFPYPQKSALERPTAPDDSSRRFLQRSRARTSAAPTPLRLETLLEANPQDESNRLPAEVAVNALMSLGGAQETGPL